MDNEQNHIADVLETPPEIAASVQANSPPAVTWEGNSGQIEQDISQLTAAQIEEIEKLTIRWVFQATLNFGMEAHAIFLNSPDEVEDVAEDITREVLDRLPGYNLAQRIYGTVDYKRARYVILPNGIIRQALFVDSNITGSDGLKQR